MRLMQWPYHDPRRIRVRRGSDRKLLDQRLPRRFDPPMKLGFREDPKPGRLRRGTVGKPERDADFLVGSEIKSLPTGLRKGGQVSAGDLPKLIPLESCHSSRV